MLIRFWYTAHMDIQIERIGKDNAYLLEQVDADVFDHEISADCLADYLSDPNCVMFLALAGKLVVGHMRAMIHHHPDRAAELYLDNLGVAPAFQRRGIATRLFAEVARVGKERGCREVWLGTEPDNEPAKAFYRSLGLKIQPMVMLHGELQ